MTLALKSAGAKNPVAVAGVTVNLGTLAEAVSETIARTNRGHGFTLFTLNLDHVVKLRWNPDFRAAYRRATLVSADGWPVAWLANRGAQPGEAKVRRTTGADLVEPICEVAARRGVGVYLVGPERGAQSAAIAALRRRHRGLRILGAEAPVIGAVAPFDHEALARRIAASGAKLCFVCLGAPKQELLADALARHCPDVGFVCVGAALDFVAEIVTRAPQWMRRSGLEWLWRLAQEPRRLAGRYLACAYVLVLLGLGLPVVPREEFR
ncbi:MAG TPA: WecB/TagA/CpsF family glycosyltransferase [Roseiarcus sp.]|jgi:exopolysaccharide biosynthesis WecB/TagA/CpsF family protein